MGCDALAAARRSEDPREWNREWERIIWMQRTQRVGRRYVAALVGSMLCVTACLAGDQPQWGQAWTRNMVSDETGLVEDFDPAAGRNVKWAASMGSETWGTPVVARGRVFLGTNND